ncbi:MAG: aminotransferase class I/II-fold pyridoxal phosphate-dependent enzyme [Gemmatimonadota bacterium]
MTKSFQKNALRTETLGESIIRELNDEAERHGAINLAQGMPDFPAPDVLKEAACATIRGDVNQYAITSGAPKLREALAKKYRDWYGLDFDPEHEITVTCGATEAMACVALGLFDPGDEVIIFEPFYENYGPDTLLAQAKPVFLRLDPPTYDLDADALRALVTPKTRAIVVNTPNNPTGRVFGREDLQIVADVCLEHDLIAITDEIYEHILYEGEHVPLATLPGMAERTVTISGMSKTYSVTGWRIGTIVAPAALTDGIRKIHDFVTVGTAAPLQEACAVGIEQLGRDYYTAMIDEYLSRRDVTIAGLREAGFQCAMPQGAYYVMADFSAISDEDDFTFAQRLIREAGVGTVPGSSFYHSEGAGRSLVRFVFCKREDTLREAAERLCDFAARGR